MSSSNPTLSTGGLDGAALEATLRAQQLASSSAPRDDDSDGSDDENESFNVNATKQSQQLTAYRSGISIHTFTSSPAVQLLHDTTNGHVCAISAQGECVIRSASDLTLLDSWRITTPDGAAVAVSAATLSGDDLIIGCISGTVQRWSLSNRAMLASWDDHKGKVSCLSIVASNLYSTGHDGFFLVRSLASGVLIHSFITCTCALVAMCIERPNLVYIGSWDGQVKRIDLDAHACTLVLKASASKESSIRALALSPSPAPPTKRKKKSAGAPEVIDTTPLVFVAHGHGEIKSWDMRTGKVIVDQYMGCGDVINTLQVIRGRLYAGGDDRCIRIFDINTGTCIDTLTGHDNGLTSLTVIDDSLFTTGYDGQWRQYQLSHIESAIAAKLTKLEEGKRLAYEAYLKAKKAGKKKRRSKKSSKGSKKGSKKKSSKKKKKQSAAEASNVAAAVAAASAAIGLNPNDFTQPDTKVLSSKKKSSSGSSSKKSGKKKSSKKKKTNKSESNGSEIKTSNDANRKNTKTTTTTTNDTRTTNITITTETETTTSSTS